MNGTVISTAVSDILHAIAQFLLVPDMVLLIAFIGYALFCIGSIIAEFFTERRHFKVAMPKFLAALMAAEEEGIPKVIEESGLLKRQKKALLTVYDYRMLPGDAMVALIKRLVGEEESRFDRIASRNNMAARVSPMLGLMGTLIPLGPGIQALGKADTAGLSASLLIAFDTTVAGLVVAAICMVIGKIRSNWYANYMSALDSGMATMLQKIEDMRAEGKITIKEPSDYAFIFEKEGAAPKKKAEEKGKGRAKKDDGTFAGRGESTGVGGASDKGRRSPSGMPLPTVSQVTPASASRAQQAGTQGAMGSSGVSGQWGQQGLSGYADPLVGVQQDVSAAFAPYQPAAQTGAQPFATGAIEPVKPLVANASFEPVPDPAFINNLASAQVHPDTGAFASPVPGAAPSQGVQPIAGWGQPNGGMPAPGASSTPQAWNVSGQPGYYDPNNPASK